MPHKTAVARADFNRHWKLLTRYGITLDEYDSALRQQGGGCALCGRQPQGKHLHVDHDHTTGKFRGVLCNRCNWALGELGDTREAIERVLRYVS